MQKKAYYWKFLPLCLFMVGCQPNDPKELAHEEEPSPNIELSSKIEHEESDDYLPFTHESLIEDEGEEWIPEED